jgi:thioredoxin-like negative regulator of GroEL
VIQMTLSVLLQAAALTAVDQDYSKAYQQTVESGRPLVVLIGADWCPGCRQMKFSSIPQVEKSGGLKKVAFAYVNTDQESELAGKLMRGSSIPQLVMFRKSGEKWERQQLTGAQSASAIQAFLEQDAEAPTSDLSSRE